MLNATKWPLQTQKKHSMKPVQWITEAPSSSWCQRQGMRLAWATSQQTKPLYWTCGLEPVFAQPLPHEQAFICPAFSEQRECRVPSQGKRGRQGQAGGVSRNLPIISLKQWLSHSCTRVQGAIRSRHATAQRIIIQPAPCGYCSIKLSDPIRQELLFLLGYKCCWCSEDKSSSHSTNSFAQAPLFLAESRKHHPVPCFSPGPPQLTSTALREAEVLGCSTYCTQGTEGCAQQMPCTMVSFSLEINTKTTVEANQGAKKCPKQTLSATQVFISIFCFPFSQWG